MCMYTFVCVYACVSICMHILNLFTHLFSFYLLFSFRSFILVVFSCIYVYEPIYVKIYFYLIYFYKRACTYLCLSLKLNKYLIKKKKDVLKLCC